MFDITSPKVSTPAILFALLSPGMLVQLPAGLDKIQSGAAFMTGSTDIKSVLFHSLVFIVVYKLLAGQMGLVLSKGDLVVTAALFILLSPGMLVSIPGNRKTGHIQVIVHTMVFAVVFAFLRKQFPQYY